METKSLFVCMLAVVQWALLPTSVLVARAATKKVWPAIPFVIDFLLWLIVIAVFLVLPLELLGLIPLGRYQGDYAFSALVGGLLSVPVARFLRRRIDADVGP